MDQHIQMNSFTFRLSFFFYCSLGLIDLFYQNRIFLITIICHLFDWDSLVDGREMLFSPFLSHSSEELTWLRFFGKPQTLSLHLTAIDMLLSSLLKPIGILFKQL